MDLLVKTGLERRGRLIHRMWAWQSRPRPTIRVIGLVNRLAQIDHSRFDRFKRSLDRLVAYRVCQSQARERSQPQGTGIATPAGESFRRWVDSNYASAEAQASTNNLLRLLKVSTAGIANRPDEVARLTSRTRLLRGGESR